MEQTYGERLVRASFNPSASSAVDQIKSSCADLITTLNEARTTASPEAARCYSLAITHLETAAMFAVKGATAPA
jgi:hypothetical protein